MIRTYQMFDFPKSFFLQAKEIIKGDTYYYANSLNSYFGNLDNIITGRNGISYTHIDSLIIAEIDKDQLTKKNEETDILSQGMLFGKIIDYTKYDEWDLWVAEELGVKIGDRRIFKDSVIAYKKNTNQNYLVYAENQPKEAYSKHIFINCYEKEQTR